MRLIHWQIRVRCIVEPAIREGPPSLGSTGLVGTLHRLARSIETVALYLTRDAYMRARIAGGIGSVHGSNATRKVLNAIDMRS